MERALLANKIANNPAEGLNDNKILLLLLLNPYTFAKFLQWI